ncbi:MAG: FAD-dependent oxidoreductase [Desulfobaccales bacterium]|nr:FAD-dependent oxidoreductase [Desulfobaccales bacterium]
MINLTINDRPVEVQPGTTVLEAARQMGINIPTLCHYEGVKPYGGCRLCLVEVTLGPRTQLTASCTYPVAEGLKVLTDTEGVLEGRRFVMDLLLSRCPEVPVLQEMARQLGVMEPSFAKGASDCILCGKCVRVCHELQHVGAIGLVGRGAKREVTTPFGEFSKICRTCGACEFVCPTGHFADIGKVSGKTPKPKLSEFNVGLNSRGNIYRLYPQAVPNTPVIDAKNCVHLLTGDCGVCAQTCPAGAIDYEQKEQDLTLKVGSVILAPGFKPFDPTPLKAYGYGRYPNVFTSLEFERILSPGGPFQGHVKRRSDGKEPKKIAWLHCVGSRSNKEGEKPYCSNFCCMVALKQAIIAREHIGPDLDMALFYMDMRTPRKDFEKYYVRIKDQGARLIRSRVHTVRSVGNNGDLEVRYITETGEVQDETFEAVVLSVGMVIPPATKELAINLDVPLGPNDFVMASCFEPVTTYREGIYSCGAFNGPKDIPQTVMEGSAAAAAASRALAAGRGTLIREKVFPPEVEVWGEPPRVGVFVCNCGLNIGGVADVPAIAAYARGIAGVEYVQENLFSCSQDAQAQMAEMIREHNLNRVVVAACSPSTHAPIFQDMLRNAGLNKYLFEMANIRNQCTWVHLNEPGAATAKCQDLVNMAVAKARLLQPLEYITVGINRKALVIGGGVTGMTSALALADQGYEVHLAERKDRLGGNALKLHTTWRGGLVRPRLEALMDKVTKHPQITIHYHAIVEEVSGIVGNFNSKLSTGQTINHGIVVIAIGAEPYRPEGLYLYKQNPNVLLSLDLDLEITKKSERLKKAQAAAFIQCVGSRTPERPYCNKVCCAHAVENAIKLKVVNPDMDIYVFYRDMRTYGERETMYQRAREKGVIFIRYLVANPPVVEEADGRIKITVMDQILQRPVEFRVDLLTLATAIIPHENAPLAELYKINLNAEGFFTEAHAKIKPVEASTEGIYLAGLCHYPKPLQESVAEALACASRANTILSREFLQLESIISNPIDENCDGCAFCVDACPFKAITLLEYMKDGSVKKTVEVNAVQCKGCGSCMATCPKQGIYVAGFTPEQLEAQVEAALGLI